MIQEGIHVVGKINLYRNSVKFTEMSSIMSGLKYLKFKKNDFIMH